MKILMVYLALNLIVMISSLAFIKKKEPEVLEEFISTIGIDFSDVWTIVTVIIVAALISIPSGIGWIIYYLFSKRH